MRSRVQELEKRLDMVEQDQKEQVKELQRDYVTHKHFDATVPPIRAMIEEIQKDIKQLLLMLAHAEEDDRDY